MKKALILVDIQNDFISGGALAVPDGDSVIAVANRLMPQYERVVATLDWHPPDHLSFASQHPGKKVGDVVLLQGQEQVLWPDHCVQGTIGAELAKGLNQNFIHKRILSGTDREIDGYSGFFDNVHGKATGLADYLKQQSVQVLDIMGLATDYCVKFTVLDAIELGLKVTVLLEGCRGIDLKPGDCDKAIAEMKQAGAAIVLAQHQ